MQNLSVFKFEESKEVRTVIMGEEIYFVGKDVAQVLGYNDTDYAVRTHCKGSKSYVEDSSGQVRHIKIIPARDVLLLLSKAHIAPEELRMKFTDFLVDNGWIEDKLFYNTRKEIEFVNTLYQLLEPFGYELIPQFRVLNYKVDLYIKDLNVVIEYDEKGHSQYTYEQHEGR